MGTNKLGENILEIRKNISDACKKSGRRLEDVILVAVTKKSTPQQVIEALNCGISNVGENRVIEASEKFDEIAKLSSKKFTKHFIGSLQTNKAKLAIETFDVIQSLDSIGLAKEIDKRAKSMNKIISVFIEVNIGNEESKSGIAPEETLAFYDKAIKFTNLRIEGLMCIAPFVDDAEDARPYFKQMKQLFDKLPLKRLSMGMSNDYAVAVEEGSNMVRIGSRIFGH